MKILFRDRKKEPVLLLYDATPQEISELVDALSSLIDGTVYSIAIHKLKGVASNNETDFTVKIGSENIGVRRIGEKAFECEHSEDEWRKIVDLVCELKKPWESTHHYLSTSGDIDLIISSGLGW